MIIRATQKKMMSKPVTSTDEGRNISSSRVLAGQPSVEWHHKADENHVSSTASSCTNDDGSRPSFATACARASASLRATYRLPASSYHAGMRCPHQSCREMHQSWILLIQCRYVDSHCSGTNRTCPVSALAIPVARCTSPSRTAARHSSWIVRPGKNG